MMDFNLFMNNLQKFLHLFLFFWTFCPGLTVDIRQGKFDRQIETSISAYLDMLTVNNVIQCGRQCLEYSHCDSVAYDDVNKLCYIQVRYNL